MINYHFKENIKEILEKPSNISNKKKYYLGDDYPGVYFTEREAQCMVFFLKYYTNWRAADVLKLSKRTIDSYLTAMRKKLDCKSKAELLSKVHKSDFVKITELFSNIK